MKCSASKYLLTTVLKEELGFEGFLISDYNAIKQIDPDFKKSIGYFRECGNGYGDGADKLPTVFYLFEGTG